MTQIMDLPPLQAEDDLAWQEYFERSQAYDNYDKYADEINNFADTINLSVLLDIAQHYGESFDDAYDCLVQALYSKYMEMLP